MTEDPPRLKTLNWSRIKRVLLNLEVIGLVVAIGLALWHSYEIRQTSHDLKTAEASLSAKIAETRKALGSVNEGLNTIRQTISTQPLGGFPEFVAEIEKTIEDAHNELEIACDFPAYGEFDRRGLPIRQAIERKIAGRLPRGVHLTFLDKEQRASSRKSQFPESDWQKWLSRRRSERTEMLNILKEHGVNSDSPKYDEFMAAMERTDSYVLQNAFKAADVKEVNVDMPVFFWIADGLRAVMVVQTFDRREDSAFTTTDPRLIAALTSIGARYRKASSTATAP